MSELSKMLIIAATPNPLSAPKVVPFAFTQSPSAYISIPCVSKSKSTSLVFGKPYQGETAKQSFGDFPFQMWQVF